jgi:hypothetical protein
LSGTAVGTGLTDTDGYYRINNLTNGSYSVVPAFSGYSFSPASASITNVSKTVNFTATSPDSPPTISSLTATPATVPDKGSTTTLSVTASGGAPLVYNWAATKAAGPVTYSVNDSGSATSSVVFFAAAGSYTFRVAVTDSHGLRSTSSVPVAVSAGAGAMVIAPYETTLTPGSSVAFQADAWDELGTPITISPTWSVSGGGTITTAGVFYAQTAGGPYLVTAVAGSLSATGKVWVVGSSTLPMVSLAAVDSSASEPGANTGLVRVVRTGSTNQAVTVNLAVSGSALHGTDYLAGGADSFSVTSAVVTLAAGVTNRDLTITPQDDPLFEGSETVVLSVRADAAYALGSPTNASLTILDDDVLAEITVAATEPTAGEPTTGEGTGTFTFTRSGYTASALTVNYTVGGTAASGADYTPIGTEVTFAAGSATATVTVSVIEDAEVEPDETVTVTLAAGVGYLLGAPSSATVTITDDDGGCVPANLVTGMTLGTAYNFFNQWLGMRLRVGASPLEVRALGRIYLSGNVQNHELRLVEVSSTSTVASVVWTPAGGVANQIKYATLAAPVTLAANTDYDLASREVSGGDQWYYCSLTTVTTTEAASVLLAVSSTSGVTWVTTSRAGHTYGPVSLQYCSVAASPAEALTIIRSIRVEAGQVRLAVSGKAGEDCRILASENLIEWRDIGGGTVGKDGSFDFTEVAVSGSPQRFYRVAVPK